MFEADTQPVIRDLCRQIAAEENPGKLEQLMHSLHNTVEVEGEEARLRMRMIVRQYRGRMSSSSRGKRIREVMGFLGFPERDHEMDR